MSNNFKQTLNLREQAEKSHSPLSRETMARRKKQAMPSKAKQIERVYNNGGEEKTRKELQQISQPKPAKVNESIFKRIVIVLASVLVVVIAIWFFRDFRGDNVTEEPAWYTIKLINNEVYYGQVSDLSADPVVVSNVYYHYDQINAESGSGDEEVNESGSLRLVKRGKETHGPSGTMNIIRAQVVYLEPLDNNSKVLQAILDYEK